MVACTTSHTKQLAKQTKKDQCLSTRMRLMFKPKAE